MLIFATKSYTARENFLWKTLVSYDNGWFVADEDLEGMRSSSCMPVGGCIFLMRRPYCTLDKRRLGLSVIWNLLVLFAVSHAVNRSFVSKPLLHTSTPVPSICHTLPRLCRPYVHNFKHSILGLSPPSIVSFIFQTRPLKGPAACARRGGGRERLPLRVHEVWNQLSEEYQSSGKTLQLISNWVSNWRAVSFRRSKVSAKSKLDC